MSLGPQLDDDGPGRWVTFLFLASILFHVAIFYTLHEMPEPESEVELIVYEVAIAEPPKPEPPKPEPEPEPEPELEVEPPPEPEVTPPPKQKPPPKKQPPKQPPPSDELPPPPKIRLPDSQLVPSGSGSAVKVHSGGENTTSPGRTQGSDKGKPRGKPKQKGIGTGGTGTAPTGPKWAPKSDIFIKKMPLPKKRPPRLQCPASRDQGVYGTVVLGIDVRRDGTVKRVKVIRGIGSGCDQIAKKALRKMTLSPAVGTDGRVADYAGLRYEYVFEPPS